MSAPRTVAVTGATGFLGRHAVAALAAQGWQVRLLARRQALPADWQAFNPVVVPGALDQPDALAALVRGAEAVLHMAGLIKARNREEFLRVNKAGTQALAEAVRRHAPGAHFLQVSSLAAREPQLSDYAASKRAGEDAAVAIIDPGHLSIVRPPAIYGPGDRETLIFFQLARQRLIPLLGASTARMAVIHVEDAARALAAQLAAPASGATAYALADDHPAGYSWQQILAAAAAAVGNTRPRYWQVPAGLLRVGAQATGGIGKLLGQPGMMTPGKLRELLHQDWSVHASERLPHALPAPQYTVAAGFAATARWYVQAGWLAPNG